MKVRLIPIVIGTGGLGNKKSGDHPNYCISEIGQNTKSPGDLKRLAVTQTSMKDHQLTLMQKLSRAMIIIHLESL